MSNLPELQAFRGVPVQRGHGLGSLFSKMFRAFRPYLVTGGKYIARKGLKTTTDIANAMLDGDKPKEAFRRNVRKLKGEIIQDAKAKIKKTLHGGRGRQSKKILTKERNTSRKKSKAIDKKTKTKTKRPAKRKAPPTTTQSKAKKRRVHNHGDLF